MDTLRNAYALIGVHFTVENLRNPDAEFVSRVFTQTLTAIGIAVPDEASLHAQQGMLFPDVQQGYYRLNFMNIMRGFFDAAGITDFSMDDMFYPKSQRIYKLFQVLIDICTQILESKALFKQVASKRMKQCELRKETEEAMKHLQDDIRQRNAVLQEKLSQRFLEKNEAVQITSCELKETQQEVVSNYQKLKQEIAETTEAITRSNETLEASKTKLEQLRHMIVDSPEMIQEQLRDASRANKLAAEQRAATAQRVASTETQLKHLRDYTTFAEELRDQLLTIISDFEQLQRSSEECLLVEKQLRSETARVTHEQQMGVKQLEMVRKELDNEHRMLKALSDRHSMLLNEIAEQKLRVEEARRKCAALNAKEAKKSTSLRLCHDKLEKLKRQQEEAQTELSNIIAQGKMELLEKKQGFDKRMATLRTVIESLHKMSIHSANKDV